MHKRARIVALLLLSATLIAACGGSGKKAPSGPTKAQFVSQADAICKNTVTRARPLISGIASEAKALFGGDTSQIAKIATQLQRLKPVTASGLASLRALAQPAGAHKQIEKFITPLAAIIASFNTAEKGLEGGQGITALATLQQDAPLALSVQSSAKAYGLRQCQTLFSNL